MASGCKQTAVYTGGARLSQEQRVTSSFQGLPQAVEPIGLFVVPQNTLGGPGLTSPVLYGTWFSCTQVVLDGFVNEAVPRTIP